MSGGSNVGWEKKGDRKGRLYYDYEAACQAVLK